MCIHTCTSPVQYYHHISTILFLNLFFKSQWNCREKNQCLQIIKQSKRDHGRVLAFLHFTSIYTKEEGKKPHSIPALDVNSGLVHKVYTGLPLIISLSPGGRVGGWQREDSLLLVFPNSRWESEVCQNYK